VQVIFHLFTNNSLRSWFLTSLALKGLMGAGIVQIAAQHGIKVALADVSEKALDNGKSLPIKSLFIAGLLTYSNAGRNIISKSLARVAKKAHPDDEGAQRSLIDRTFGNIRVTTSPEDAAKESDLIIEAIVENISLKKALFADLDLFAPDDAVFATNTSSLSVTEIASATSAKRRKRFLGVHFFNPVGLVA
jgi:3-hydroxyacyl-CoA dehydrogenase